MASLFSKIKRLLGFYPEVNYYKIGEKTGEPVKVSYEQLAPTPPVPQDPPVIAEPISSQEAAVDTKDDGIDLAAMTKAELIQFGNEKGIAVNARMKKQEIIDKINESI